MEDIVIPVVMNDVFFYPKEDTLKISCWYLNYKCVKNGEGQEGGYLEDVEGSW